MMRRGNFAAVTPAATAAATLVNVGGLNLLAAPNLLETPGNLFAHNCVSFQEKASAGDVAIPGTHAQLLCVIATIRTFLFSHTRTQFAAVSSSAFVGESPATQALVNFTPRGCRM